MNTFSSLIEALGWALVHCLWQGTTLALLLALLLRAWPRSTAAIRYGAATTALGLLLICFGATMVMCWPKITAVPSPALAALPLQATPLPKAVAAAPAAKTITVTAPAPSAPSPAADPPAPIQAPEPIPALPWTERLRTFLPWAVAVWAIGVLFLSARFLAGWLRIRRWVARAVPVDDEEWQTCFAALATALKISRPVRLLVSSALTVPAVIGWLKPVVLVPAGIFTGLSAAQLEAILAHELAHIRRHDYLVNLLQTLVETLFFFHPAAWWISRRMRDERENCCDDLAAETCGSAVGYARALTALEELRGTTPALAPAASGGSLLARIRRLLGVKEQPTTAWPLAIFLVGLAALWLSASMIKAAPPVDATPQAAEIFDGKYRSYCVYQGNELRFVLLSKHEFTVKKGSEPGMAEIIFTKGRKAEEHHLHLAPVPNEPNLLRVSRRRANLHFNYDLMRSRVFHVDFDLHGFSPFVVQVPVAMEPITAPEILTRESAKVAAWLQTSDARQRWEYTRVKITDREYASGKPIAQADAAIVWSEPNEVGLRLGLGGLPQNAAVPVGQDLPVTQHIRNDGRETLRFSATGSFNEGVNGDLRDASGAKLQLRSGYRWQMFGHHIQLAPGEFITLQSSPLQTILALKDGTPSSAARSYTSCFVVSPGEYTLHLSHNIGQFLRDPVNADVSDPRLAPGLGEWRGSLNAPPIAVRILPPKVSVAKPGMAEEFARIHRIVFQKGKLLLSHPAPGLTHTGTYVKDASGNWPSSGGSWRVHDPGGDYVAAWDEGGMRVWVVDATGIQRLDLGENFTDGGYWALEEATGDLGAMPDGVRAALKLPARKVDAPSPQPTADALTVRGVSLQDVPSTKDRGRLPDLFEPDPKEPGQFRQKAGVFDFPLVGEKDNPVLFVPKGRPVFYLEFRSRIYGPITGDAAVELGLTQLLRQKLAEVPNREGLALLEKMIRSGSEPIRTCACRIMGELPVPPLPFDYDGIFHAAIGYSIETHSPMAQESRMGLAHIQTMVWTLRDHWNRKRVQLPEDVYLPGEKIAPEDPAIAWGEPDASGVRLGISGLEAVKSIAAGKNVPIAFFLRNDGPAEVKFSWAPRLNDCLRAWLIDDAGTKHPGGYCYSSGFIDYRHSRLAPGQQLKVATSELEVFGQPKDIQDVNARKGFEYCPRIAAPPGQYTLHFDYSVGHPDFVDVKVPPSPTEKLEWTARLSSKPLPIAIEAP